ncbi:MAG: hypothetical protein MJ236_00940, partial [Clostridia bacterium]|nr:hypothetical protein [Clostridia bacterium]
KTSASFEVYEYSRGEYIKREYGMEFKALGNVIKTNNLDYDFIRSGYPISLDVIVSNSTPNKYSSFSDDMFTIPQRAYVLYPEFEYEYSCGLYTTLMYENNKLSLIPNENGDNTHFIPINAPDGKYSLILRLDDIWTPCGCVNLNLILEIDINGSIYDDWYRN